MNLITIGRIKESLTGSRGVGSYKLYRILRDGRDRYGKKVQALLRRP